MSTVRAWCRGMRAGDWARDAEQLIAVRFFLDRGQWPWEGTYGNVQREDRAAVIYSITKADLERMKRHWVSE